MSGIYEAAPVAAAGKNSPAASGGEVLVVPANAAAAVLLHPFSI